MVKTTLKRQKITRKEWQAKKYDKGRANKARQGRKYNNKKSKTEGQ